MRKEDLSYFTLSQVNSTLLKPTFSHRETYTERVLLWLLSLFYFALVWIKYGFKYDICAFAHAWDDLFHGNEYHDVCLLWENLSS